MSSLLLTDGFRVNQAEQFLESFSEADKTVYYMTFSRHVPWTNGVVPEVSSSIEDIELDPMNHMIFAKRITPDDVALAIPRIDWVEDTVYDQYDHRTEDPSLSQFYVGVTEGSNYNVFKCLFNNNGAASEVSPSFAAFSLVESADTETYDGYYETADGYQWKYMFTVSSVEMTKFSTSAYIPLIANSTVEEFSVPGAIDVVVVENGGAGYNNYFDGEFSLTSDINYLGNNTYFALRSTNDIAPSTTEDFYNGCIFLITGGKGAGQYREVVDYVNSGSARYVELDEPFNTVPDTTSTFEITPKVTIIGKATTNAIGRAIIGTSNSVSRVEILNRGEGYFAASARILNSNVAAESNTATLVPIVPPKGGHGSNAKVELGARWITISVKVTGDENGVIPTGQKFCQVGILKDPTFSNLEVTTLKYSNTEIAGRDGGFIEGETVLIFDPILQAGTANVTAANSYVSTTNSEILVMNQIDYPHSRAFVQSANGSEWFVSTILSSNSTVLVMEDNVPFTDNLAKLYISSSNVTAKYVSTGATWSYLTDAQHGFEEGVAFIGLQSYARAVIDEIQVNNNVVNDFDVINQLSIIAFNSPSSTFTTDDFLSDEDGLNTCYFHSYANGSHIYVTGITGDMAADTVLTNQTVSASVVVANKYNGEMVPDSGSVIYIENHEPVSRETSTSQTKKITVEF